MNLKRCKRVLAAIIAVTVSTATTASVIPASMIKVSAVYEEQLGHYYVKNGTIYYVGGADNDTQSRNIYLGYGDDFGIPVEEWANIRQISFNVNADTPDDESGANGGVWLPHAAAVSEEEYTTSYEVGWDKGNSTVVMVSTPKGISSEDEGFTIMTWWINEGVALSFSNIRVTMADGTVKIYSGNYGKPAGTEYDNWTKNGGTYTYYMHPHTDADGESWGDEVRLCLTAEDLGIRSIDLPNVTHISAAASKGINGIGHLEEYIEYDEEGRTVIDIDVNGLYPDENGICLEFIWWWLNRGESIEVTNIKAEYTPVTDIIEINEANFPDPAFRSFISENYDYDKDGVIPQQEANEITWIDVSGKEDAPGNITSLKGVELFPNLTGIDGGFNKLTSIDVSTLGKLEFLNVESNKLTSIDVTKNPLLTYLGAKNNKIASIDVTNNVNLEALDLGNNQLTKIDISNNTKLTGLWLWENDMKGISVSHLPALKELCLNNSNISEIDVSNNPLLENLAVIGNSISYLDVSKNPELTTLYCSWNNLAGLDLSNNKKITDLECDNCIMFIGNVNGSFGLSDVPGFNPAKASGWSGAEYDMDTNSLKNFMNANGGEVTYTYDLGNGKSEEFKIIYDSYSAAKPVVWAEAGNGCVTLNWNSMGDNATYKIYRYNGGSSFTAVASNVKGTSYTVENLTNGKMYGFLVRAVIDGVVTPYTVDDVVYATPTALEGNVKLDETNFPDPTLRKYIADEFDWDKDGELSADEISGIEWIIVGGTAENPGSITTLKGIEYFTNLKGLGCEYNKLTSLDVSMFPNLEFLACYNNDIKTLNISKNPKLTELHCENTGITSLDVSKNPALTSLFCSENKLASLDLSKNYALTELHCWSCGLTELDLGSNRALTVVNLFNNDITKLNLSNNTKLRELNCISNGRMLSLDVSMLTRLTKLECSWCSISSLDLSSNTALEYLDVSGNPIKQLDLSKNTGLETLECSWTELTSLDLSRNHYITKLGCEGCRYNIGAVNGGFYLDDLKGFDPARASDWKDAEYDIDTNSLRDFAYPDGGSITYTYNCGNGMTADFELWYDSYSAAKPNVKAVPGDGTVTLKWASIGEGAAYRIYRYNGGSSFTAIASNITDTSYTVKDLKNGTRYGFLVRATVNGKLSPYTINDVVYATPRPGAVDVEINETNFPDAAFRSYVSSTFDWDNDGIIHAEDFDEITWIDVSGTESKPGKIKSLKGIEYFYNLNGLCCSFNNITSLDVSCFPELTFLGCDNNKLTKLDLTHNAALEWLCCGKNKLTGLDVSQNPALKEIHCWDNEIESLDVSRNTNLVQLYCNGNKIGKLDLSNNSKLTMLGIDCESIDLSNLTNLKELFVGGNEKFTSIDLSKNIALTKLELQWCPITSIDLSKNTALEELTLEGTEVLGLDLSKNTALKKYEFNENRGWLGDVYVSTKITDVNKNVNPARIISMDGAEYNSKTGEIKNFANKDGGKVTYLYDCGNGITAEFTLYYDKYFSEGEDPDVPSKLTATATAGDGCVTLSWNSMGSNVTYKIYRYNKAKGTFSSVASNITELSYTVSGLTNGTEYGFLVRANVNGTLTPYTAEDIVYATPVSSSSTKLKVNAAAGNGSVTLSWNSMGSGATYKIYRYNKAKDSFTSVASKVTDLTYTVTGLTNDTEYGFLVRANINGTLTPYTSADIVYATPTDPSASKPNVKATSGNGSVTLTWDSMGSNVTYKVYGYDKATKKYTVIAPLVNGTSHTVKGLENGKEYGFLVRANINGKLTSYTVNDIVYATPKGTVTKPKVDAKAGNGSATLSWNDMGSGVTYSIYRYNKSTKKFTSIVSNISETTYTVPGLTNGTEYGFLVRAKINGSLTPYSVDEDIVYVTPQGASKPNVKAKAGNGSVTLTWDSMGDNITYNIYRYDKSTKKFTSVASNVSKSTYTVKNLENGKEYGFLVRAKINGALTPYSVDDVVYETPKA